jgi:hypothetical protein
MIDGLTLLGEIREIARLHRPPSGVLPPSVLDFIRMKIQTYLRIVPGVDWELLRIHLSASLTPFEIDRVFAGMTLPPPVWNNHPQSQFAPIRRAPEPYNAPHRPAFSTFFQYPRIPQSIQSGPFLDPTIPRSNRGIWSHVPTLPSSIDSAAQRIQADNYFVISRSYAVSGGSARRKTYECPICKFRYRVVAHNLPSTAWSTEAKTGHFVHPPNCRVRLLPNMAAEPPSRSRAAEPKDWRDRHRSRSGYCAHISGGLQPLF